MIGSDKDSLWLIHLVTNKTGLKAAVVSKAHKLRKKHNNSFIF